MQNLAISYVNESHDLPALSALHTYLLTLSPNHTHPAPTQSQMTSSPSPWAIHQSMTDAFLDLAKRQYREKGGVDADLQVGLGTLFYMMGDYGEARGCWVAALEERPEVSASSRVDVWVAAG
jgi:peroxin-5